MGRNYRNLVADLLIPVVSTLLFVLFIELIFPYVLHKVPLSIYVGLDDGYKVLGQSTKKSVIPKDYIAIVGDSNALGQGDWYLKAVKQHKFSQGDYHSAHIIHNRTGRDVISYGALGSGSLRGLVSQPILHHRHINSLRAFTLEEPEMILVYFYEGNDLDDNVLDLKRRYENRYDMDRIYDTEYFKQFIQETVIEKDPLYNADGFLKNFLFTRFLVESFSDNVPNEIRRGYKKFRRGINELLGRAEPPGHDEPPLPQYPVQHNIALIGGKEFQFPLNNQAPALELTAEETKRAIYVFEQSILFLAEFFKKSSLAVVFIPSPMSVYQWESSPVIVPIHQSYGGYEPAVIYERSRELCRKVQDIAQKYKFKFADTTRSFKDAAAKELIHGPRDGMHPNEQGYRALAEGVIAAFFEPETSPGFMGCAPSQQSH